HYRLSDRRFQEVLEEDPPQQCRAFRRFEIRLRQTLAARCSEEHTEQSETQEERERNSGGGSTVQKEHDSKFWVCFASLRPSPLAAATQAEAEDRSLYDRRTHKLRSHDTRGLWRHGHEPRSCGLGADADEIQRRLRERHSGERSGLIR
ncbi:hypothetical protein cypCar_00042361, partial [Cyprinus carpio]